MKTKFGRLPGRSTVTTVEKMDRCSCVGARKDIGRNNSPWKVHGRRSGEQCSDGSHWKIQKLSSTWKSVDVFHAVQISRRSPRMARCDQMPVRWGEMELGRRGGRVVTGRRGGPAGTGPDRAISRGPGRDGLADRSAAAGWGCGNAGAGLSETPPEGPLPAAPAGAVFLSAAAGKRRAPGWQPPFEAEILLL